MTQVKLTNQAIFDECATHVLKQGTQALKKGGNKCTYLNSKGQSCALGGPLVKRGLLSKRFEALDLTANSLIHNTVRGDDVRIAELDLAMALNIWGMSEKQLPLVGDIQSAHDADAAEGTYIDGFKERMKAIAKFYKLSTAVLDKKVRVRR